MGNAGLLVPSHARPIAAPESLRAGLRGCAAGLAFRHPPEAVAGALAAAHLRACAPGRADAAERLQRELCRESLELLAGLAEAGIDAGFRRRGCLTVHMGEAAGEHAAAEATSETGRRLGARALDGAEARRELEPLLSDRVRAAVLFPHEGDCDPVRLVRSAGALAAERGVRLRDGVEVTRCASTPAA